MCGPHLPYNALGDAPVFSNTWQQLFLKLFPILTWYSEAVKAMQKWGLFSCSPWTVQKLCKRAMLSHHLLSLQKPCKNSFQRQQRPWTEESQTQSHLILPGFSFSPIQAFKASKHYEREIMASLNSPWAKIHIWVLSAHWWYLSTWWPMISPSGFMLNRSGETTEPCGASQSNEGGPLTSYQYWLTAAI